MSPESRERKLRVRQDTEDELNRITGWYLHDRILGDGLSDALAYATSLLNYNLVYDIKDQYNRWRRVIDLATRPEGSSLVELRAEILKDSAQFLKDSKATKTRTYGIVLRNLADSIPAS